ncbi:hypothetical protein [Sodalis sp.]|uniref:hypothetical protein n=1 Tax=Sodalis sp. (in: enterobacteria) TaxID=1898979 RepID=UPI003872BE5A
MGNGVSILTMPGKLLRHYRPTTLSIAGADTVYPRVPIPGGRYRETLRQQFSHAHVVARSGHWVHAEKPEAVVRAGAHFLTEA